ncbi:MAG: hypothetical protein DRN81_00370 [Thermoproteota archaeon]|nr:MAG: hypothetical protein DRN81_00370 [Candidatus Korarchaeota archaeon]
MGMRVGVPMTDVILEELKKRAADAVVWRIYYPMRKEDPIEVTVEPGTATLPLEFTVNNRKVVVKEGTRPPRTAARRTE